MRARLGTFGPIGRPVIAFALLAALLWGAGVTWASQQGKTLSAGNATQQAAAEKMLLGLTAPADATKDVYGSACLLAAPYCVTSTGDQKSLMTATTVVLKANGAKVSQHRCATPDAGALGGQCLETLSFHGARLLLATDTASTASIGSSLTVIVGKDDYQVLPAKPLPSWSRLNPLPVSWNVTAPCASTNVAGQCLVYRNAEQPGVVAVGLAHADAAVTSALTAAGYGLQRHQCYESGGSLAKRCSFAAHRFRTVGGHDEVDAIVSVSEVDADHTTVGVTFSTFST